MTNKQLAYGDKSLVGVGDWVTNDDEMLGEPHEIVESADGHWICCESAGHVVRIHWTNPTLRRADRPKQEAREA